MQGRGRLQVADSQVWTARPFATALAHHLLASKKMSDKEDTIPEGYTYAWRLASDLSLEDFLKKACISQLVIRLILILVLCSISHLRSATMGASQ